MRRRVRNVAAGLALLGALLVAHDATRASVSDQISTRAALAAIEGYRATISPRLTGVVHCRFQPTCSAFGLETVRKYGALRGGWKAVGRIVRCGPWTPAGTVDAP